MLVRSKGEGRQEKEKEEDKEKEEESKHDMRLDYSSQGTLRRLEGLKAWSKVR